ncbi:MAG: FAD-dependent thymidylate synthase [Oscillatoriales cyanobacterium]|nr:MAG: FAD-dependent thymidylate synthase [Oscillatoriales cyanobacterium]
MPNPQQLIWAAMHQDYSEDLVADQGDRFPNEAKAGELVIKHLLQGNRGHFGPIEHPQIVFNVGFFPHSTMQQLRTHRVGVSFDVQCLAGDTEITFVNCKGETNRKLRKSIAELYDLWTNGEQAVRERQIQGRKGQPPGTYRRDCRKRLQKMRLRALNEETGLFETGSIRDVMCSGLQPVYRLTLENGRTLDCTTNHRLFTPQGWQTMAEAVGLATDDQGEVLSIERDRFIMCNGIAIEAETPIYQNESWLVYQIQQGKTAPEIARVAQCSSRTIYTWAERYGLSLPKSHQGRRSGDRARFKNHDRPVHRELEWLTDKITAGYHADEMAEMAGCSVSAIKKWVYFHGLTLNKRPPGSEIPWNKNRGGYRLNLSENARDARRALGHKITRRGAASHFWRGGVSSDRVMNAAWTRQVAPQVHQKFDYTCQNCGVRGGELHAHHLVPVYADPKLAYDLDNLVTVCRACHQNIHHNHQEQAFAERVEHQVLLKAPLESWQKKPQPGSRKLQAHPVRVIAVEYLGVQMTYDLEVEGPWHNFVANGLVVHNSFRYSGMRILDVLSGKRTVEEIFYLRPVGDYSDRQGKKYFYSPAQRQADLDWCLAACQRYQQRIQEGLSEEHARGLIPFDVRQHFVMSCNARSLMHILDLRAKADAQLEIQRLCDLLMGHFKQWMPQVADWYETNRLGKARLSP